MKQFRLIYLALLCFLFTTGSHAQTLTVSPDVICPGGLINLNLIYTAPSGLTIIKVVFDMKNDGTDLHTFTSPPYRVLEILPPGNYKAKATVTLSDNSTVTTPLQDILVYFAPVVNTAVTSQVTQCFTGNKFCFSNLSHANPSSPSNQVMYIYTNYGDATVDSVSSQNNFYCHSYNSPISTNTSYDILISVIDNKGCRKDSLFKKLVTLHPNITSDFKWTFISGPCFKTCYQLKNLASAAASEIQKFRWDFGDSSIYEGSGINDPFKHYDTILHCYTKDGQFNPALTLTDTYGCVDSTRKKPGNTTQGLPQNISFKFDVTTSATLNQLNTGMDSVCKGNGGGSICFKMTPISFAQAGVGDFVWNFGDPNDPLNQNLDSFSWSPCHYYKGLGAYFPSITIKNICYDTTFYYYSTISTWSRLDSSTNRDNDYGLNPNGLSATLAKPYKSPIAPDSSETMALYNAHSTASIPQLLEDGNSDALVYAFTTKAKDKIIYFRKTYPITFVSGPNTLILDSIRVPVNQVLHFTRVQGANKALYHKYNAITGKYDSVYAYTNESDRPAFLFRKSSLITDTNSNQVTNKIYIYQPLLNSFKMSSYGVEILGPRAAIEEPALPVVIKASQKNQCGPTDTVDFVNSSDYFKSRKIWRRWDFDDYYAPQCTSFSVPKRGYAPMNVWNTAQQQDLGSEHYFLLNGMMYPGKMSCRFSMDTLPRHAYKNWDTVYTWYKSGHDFMPWNAAKWDTVSPPAPGKFYVQPADKAWWGKPVYLNILTGAWSLVPGTSSMQHLIKSYLYTDPSSGKSGTRYYVDSIPSNGSPNTVTVQWPRIDTMNLKFNNGQDLVPGSPLIISNVTDPIGLSRGKYVILNGLQIDTAGPVMQIKSQGDSWTLSPTTVIPGGGTFYEYVFRKTVQRCITVKLKLQDSSNNASKGSTINDSLILDNYDCFDESSVQLAFGKADARGLGISGKFCPGLSSNAFGANIRFSTGAMGLYPGITPSCGQTNLLFNYDSLADRKDKTPCTLDGFVGFQGGTTAGGIMRPPMYSGTDFNPTTVWTNPSNTSFVYHYGFNTGTPPPADTLNGWVTVGVQVGNGCKDSVAKDVLLSNYRAHPQLYESINSYSFNKVFNIRSLLPAIPDTLIDIEYVDCNTPRCLSSPVWYHNFLRINNLDAQFTEFPRQLENMTWKLRGKEENITVFSEDSIQDSIKVDLWMWGDATATVDSFWYAGNDSVNDGFYVNGMRRVRYNLDLINPDQPILIDSTVWPIHASFAGAGNGLRPRTPGAYKKVFYDTVDFCTGQKKANPNFMIVDTAMMFFPITHKYVRTSWEADTRITPYKGPDANISSMIRLITSTSGCQQIAAKLITIGVIDTFDSRNSKGESDSVFCEKETVFFYDSVRYWRWDTQVSSLPFFPDVTRNPVQGKLTYGYPENLMQIDTFNFWRYREFDPLDFKEQYYQDSIGLWNPATGKLDYLREKDSIFTERTYWDFGDGTFPLHLGRNPIHSYEAPGRYKVTMFSIDSMGHWDTCIRYVNIGKLKAKIGLLNNTFNCGVPAVPMWDSSSVGSGGNLDSLHLQYWWFGDNKQDTINPYTPATGNPHPIYPYRTNGKFTIKLVVQTLGGCLDTTRRSIRIGGPRPYFRIIGDSVGCAPYMVALVNMADSFDRITPGDTPTRVTRFDWGDLTAQSTMRGRRDTIFHTYVDPGVFSISAIGTDEDDNGVMTCPPVIFPDTTGGLQYPIHVYINDLSVGKISGKKAGKINDTSTYFVDNQSSFKYTWTLNGGTIQSGNGTHKIVVKWPAAVGVYKIIVKKEKIATGGCISYDTLLVDVTLTALKDLNSLYHIDLYPNPSNSELNLSLNTSKTQDLQFTLMNVLGQVCVSDQIKNVSGKYIKTYPVGQLNSGVYFTIIQSAEGRVVNKVVIER